jgi:hypothetical protein
MVPPGTKGDAMSAWNRVRELVTRAKAGAADVAQTANIKLDIRNLEGRRDHLFREIGRKVWTLHGEGRRIPEFETLCEEIAQIEQRVREKERELETRKERPDAADGQAATG